MNDILLTSDHPLRSFLRISRRDGYAQYGGMPVIIESDYHISKTEYERRLLLPWPTDEGAFVPGEQSESQVQPQSPKQGNPKPTMEVIGECPSQPASGENLQSIDDLFGKFKDDFPSGDDDKRGTNK